MLEIEISQNIYIFYYLLYENYMKGVVKNLFRVLNVLSQILLPRVKDAINLKFSFIS